MAMIKAHTGENVLTFDDTITGGALIDKMVSSVPPVTTQARC